MGDVRARLDDIAGHVWKPDPVNGPRVRVRLLANPEASAMHAALASLLDLADQYAGRAAELRATVEPGELLLGAREVSALINSTALEAAAKAIRGTIEAVLS